jgi:hypoxanthine phosphoribosyltransferase
VYIGETRNPPFFLKGVLVSKVPQHYQILYSKEQIDERIQALGKEIDSWIDTTSPSGSRDVLALPVMRGGLYFFADLSRAMENSLEVNPVQSWAYNGEENTALPTGVTVRFSDLPVKGRRVLVIDDICDSGRTLKTIHEDLTARGAAEVQVVVLVRRAVGEPSFSPQWCGFEYDGPEWFVGYGMDDGSRWRNLPEIYLVN